MPNMAMATDAICGAFNEAWASTQYAVEWPNIQGEGPKLSDGDQPYERLTLQHDGSDQATLGPPGERTFTRMGQVCASVFVPAGKRGLVDHDALAMVAASAYEGVTREGVRFYRVGPKSVPYDGGAWLQVNVWADFEFDEVR